LAVGYECDFIKIYIYFFAIYAFNKKPKFLGKYAYLEKWPSEK
jgi:hypothetical protein